MCSASMSPRISVCQDAACNAAAIEIGDTVTFQVCVENLSFEIPGSAESTPVTAILQSSTAIEIFLACKVNGACNDGMFTGTLSYQSYTADVPSTLTMGTAGSCTDPDLCGLLELAWVLSDPFGVDAEDLPILRYLRTAVALSRGSTHKLAVRTPPRGAQVAPPTHEMALYDSCCGDAALSIGDVRIEGEDDDNDAGD